MNMSKLTASGYCITYGPCEYHATILPNALIDNDGREVPVRYFSTEIIGVARLTHTDKGVIADVKLVPNEYSLAKMSSNSSGSWMVGDLLAIESGKSFLLFGP